MYKPGIYRSAGLIKFDMLNQVALVVVMILNEVTQSIILYLYYLLIILEVVMFIYSYGILSYIFVHKVFFSMTRHPLIKE